MKEVDIFLLQHAIEYSAYHFPSKIAVIDHDEKITYQQLNSFANKIARFIKGFNFLSNSRICTLFENGMNSVCALAAILKADCSCVPLDAQSPPQRLVKMIKQSTPQMIITDDAYSQTALIIAQEFPSLKIFVFSDDQENTTDDYFNLKDIEPQDEKNIVYNNVDTDLAYVLFTSGSTGSPKGVMISHRSMLNFCSWAKDKFKVTPNDVISSFAPHWVDQSIFDLFVTFAGGATVCIVKKEDVAPAVNFLKFIDEHKVTIWTSTPSVLAYLAQSKVLQPNTLNSLRVIAWGGESFPQKYLSQWRKVYPQKTFINVYGLTETTVDNTYYIVDNKDFDKSQSVPIGIPCEHNRIMIVDENNQQVATEQIGELCVLGSCVSYGYIHEATKTKEAFTQNPYNNLFYEPMMKTKDIVRQREDGHLEFVGRKDNQVKIKGYRIELGEVESAINAFDFVKECCVVATKSEVKKELIAYIVFDDKNQVSFVKEKLKTALPVYMMPKQVVCVDSLPRTTNGKMDRVQLQNMFASQE